jgi:3'-phosphoadenosine 5'-phosphosulfate (PAPS) 3'-phosphatase
MHIKKYISFLLISLCTVVVYGSDMVYSFKSSSFNGVNFSNTAMTVENLARTRKQAIKETIKSEAEQTKIQESNTPLNTFINNLQARIYSQLASQVTDQIFNSSGATFGVINLQGGSTVTWQRNGEFATLYIVDPASGTTTQITVPVGSLAPIPPG